MVAVKERIVAEASKTWSEGDMALTTDTVSTRFEHIIEVNSDRGYVLEDWKYQQTSYRCEGKQRIQETIIAVFVKKEWERQ